MTPLQTSILATLDDIIIGQRALGLRAEREDMQEALKIIERIYANARNPNAEESQT